MDKQSVEDVSLKDLEFVADANNNGIGTDKVFRRKIVWPNAVGFLVLNVLGFYGLLLMVLAVPDIRTTAFAWAIGYLSVLAVTMGAHRMWTHRAFKANAGVRAVLLFFVTVAGQNCLWEWIRDHRQHHKYSDTDADPHNSTRGFFFSHIGWLMSRKHPMVIEYGKKIDMSDIEADRWIMWQKKYFLYLYLLISFALPVAIPVYFWGETFWVSFLTCFCTRTTLSLNGTWLVNSAAHMFGTRPYDETISPVETTNNLFLGLGEGWHNYHHAFPWDYKAAELGTPWNVTRQTIEFCARMGWVWDLREAPRKMVKQRVLRTGDGTYDQRPRTR